MARVCSICTHAGRGEINSALVAGEPFRRIAARFGVTEQAIRRHQAGHLPATLARAQQAKEVARADDLLRQVRGLAAKSIAILNRAEQAGDLKVALSGIREARECVALLLKARGELGPDTAVQVNVVGSAEWLRVRAVLVAALAPFPDARVAVAGALAQLEEAGGDRD